MCFLVTSKLFCPCCTKHHSSTVSILRCAISRPWCVDWSLGYLHAFRPVTREGVCHLSADSDSPFKDFVSITRPCRDCAIQLIRGARLIDFEKSVGWMSPASKYISPVVLGSSLHVTKTTDYTLRAGGGVVDGRTLPIFMPAVFSSGGVPTLVYERSLGRYVVKFVEGSPLQYDALEYHHWSWEFSPGSSYRGAFNHIPRLPRSSARVGSRFYDPVTQLWAHPFMGEVAERAIAVQQAPPTGREMSDVLRSYTINGAACDRGVAFLAPDCFAPTLWTAKEIRASMWEFATRGTDLTKIMTLNGKRYYLAPDGVYRRPILDTTLVLRSELVFKSVMIV